MKKKKKTEGSHQRGALVQGEDGGGEAPFSRSHALGKAARWQTTLQQGPHHKPQNLSVSPQPVGSVGTPEQVGRGRGTQVHCTARKLRVRAHLLGVQGDTTPGPQESLSL